nr:hypothetical protein [Tanacetum cinerariifolium]
MSEYVCEMWSENNPMWGVRVPFFIADFRCLAEASSRSLSSVLLFPDRSQGKLIQKLLLNQKCIGYLVRAYYSISPTRYYKDDSCWSADLKLKTTEDIISNRSFMEVLTLDHYVLVKKVKDKQEKDKIESKPDKNGKRGEARQCRKPITVQKERKMKKIQVQWTKRYKS